MEQLQLLLRQLTTSQKIGVGFGALASAFVLVVFVVLAGQPNMQPAFTRLSASDAAAISDALRSAKISFQVADAGATILVPATSLADARVAAAAAGVSAGSSADGFALFDKTGFGMSEFDQRVTYQRALEGKLTATIQAMSGVDSASVSIVAAQDGIFASQDRPATASVLLRMRGGLPPDGAMVRGIVSAVSSAVSGLTPENVTVVDEAGRLLAGPQGGLAGDALAMKQGVERDLAAKVQALVDRALGPGHASVAVSATLNMDKVEQTVTTVKPIDTANWTPASVQTAQEQYAGAVPGGVGGIPGVSSNVPGLPTYPGAAQGSAASPNPGASPSPAASAGGSPEPSPAAYVSLQQTVNFNNSQTVARVISEPGAVERLSVAVLLDQAALGSLTADGLKGAIEAAIGSDQSRGDVVSVSAVSFAAPAATIAPSGPVPGDLAEAAGGVASTVAGVVGAAALLFLVWRNLRALRGRAEEMELVTVRTPEPAMLGSYASDGSASPLASIAELDQSPQAQVQERLRMVASEKPDAIVGMMNSWLREDGRR